MIGMLTRAVTEGEQERRLEWKKYTRRTWVVGTGDAISAQRAREFEEMVTALAIEQDGSTTGRTESEDASLGSYDIATVPRAREIHQPIYTAPISCLRSMLACFNLLLRHQNRNSDLGFPDLILCNGPATATILVFTSILLRFFNIRRCNTRGKMRTIYVESWARVKKLSLSGLLLSRVVDRFLVQWPQLEKEGGGRVEYLGVLV